MGLFDEIKGVLEGISAANAELREGVKEVYVETKQEIISDWKKEAPLLGNTAEKVDRAITTLANVVEQLPEPLPDPLNPDIKLKKTLKKLKKSKSAISKDKVKRAQHLKVDRLGYSHHALSINNSEVIHYQQGEIVISSIQSFAKGATIYVIDTPRLYKKDEVIARAYSKLGERQYHPIFNNCEHFIKWAMHGE
ncbi:MAG: lecithin retinol acyltransferase family protein [Solibacillus sp.]